MKKIALVVVILGILVALGWTMRESYKTSSINSMDNIAAPRGAKPSPGKQLGNAAKDVGRGLVGVNIGNWRIDLNGISFQGYWNGPCFTEYQELKDAEKAWEDAKTIDATPKSLNGPAKKLALAKAVYDECAAKNGTKKD